MKQLIDLSGKQILIIGASSGIGRQTAITLSRIGASVALVARREENLRETLGLLEGDNHSYYCADVSRLDSLEELFAQVLQKKGPLDGLVYTAGITGSMPLKMLKPEKLLQVMNVNFLAFVECVRQFSKKGCYQCNASIVGVSSVAARCGDKTHTAYSASKAAMESAVRCMAVELAEKSITVNTVAPGMIKTEMFESYVERVGAESESVRRILARQYLGFGEMQDIANAIAFLLSPAAAFITGTTLSADGGYTTC